MSKEENHVDNPKSNNNGENRSDQSDFVSVEDQSTKARKNDDKQQEEHTVLESSSDSNMKLDVSTLSIKGSNLQDQATDNQKTNDYIDINQQSTENIHNVSV
jgi:hypothetical protein